MTDDLSPRWASAPGETIAQVLTARAQAPAQLAGRMGVSVTAVEELLAGRASITIDTAQRLSDAVGASIEFWMARDAQYRDDLARVAADVWAQRLPVPEMVRMGWIPPVADWRERIEMCTRFFGLDDSSEWSSRYEDVLAAASFRTSSAFAGTAEAVTAWLRRAEVLAEIQPSESWDPEGLQSALPAVARLSRQRDPLVFLPKLKALLGSVGVIAVLVRPPSSAPISGAVWRAPDGRRLLGLSGRHLSDDHFWFTVLHEVGHLLLHDVSQPFVDQIDDAPGMQETDSRELAANAFAANTLLPEPARQSLPERRICSRDVLRLSGAHGVSPGVVVGLLQHDGVLGFHQLNHLKRRYRWDGEQLTSK